MTELYASRITPKAAVRNGASHLAIPPDADRSTGFILDPGALNKPAH